MGPDGIMCQHTCSGSQHGIGGELCSSKLRNHPPAACNENGISNRTEKNEKAAKIKLRIPGINPQLPNVGDADTQVGQYKCKKLVPVHLLPENESIDQHSKAGIQKQDEPFQPC